MSRRSVSAVLVCVSGLAFGGVSAGAAADLCVDLKFRCDGFEPSWQLLTDVDGAGDTVVRFTDPENPNFETEPLVFNSCLLQGSPNDFELTTEAPLSLIANIVGQSCTLPNGEATDFSVSATYMQGAVSDSPTRVEGAGCCRLLE
jgi:hypothetical protein